MHCYIDEAEHVPSEVLKRLRTESPPGIIIFSTHPDRMTEPKLPRVLCELGPFRVVVNSSGFQSIEERCRDAMGNPYWGAVLAQDRVEWFAKLAADRIAELEAGV